jgi:all-trans-retinol 13,14-reductase
MKKYDVVIIGAGLGGLECGAILSKEGRTVCIIEKNEQIGGSLQTFRREGVKFDTGVHYIGSLDKGQNLYQFFNYLGIMKRLHLQRMDATGFDVVLFQDDECEYPYGMGYENFTQFLSQKFPAEKVTIEKYCRDIKRICDNFPLYNISRATKYEDTEIFTRSAKQYLEELTPNVRLRNVLAGTNLLYVGVGDKTPLYVHALVVNSYIESSWRCSDGGDQISKLLAREIKAHHGVIMRGKKVSEIHVEEDRAIYVQLQDGTKIYGENFISNIHPAQTMDITETDRIKPAYRKRIKGLENSISIFVLYIILKPGSLKYKNRNYYYFEQNEVWNCCEYTHETWPASYALFEAVPRKQKEFTEVITVMTYMKYDEVKKWANTVNTTLDENSRGDDYDEFKRMKSEKLLDTMEKKFPDFRSRIKSYYSSTPLSYRDYIGTEDGNMYGVAKDFNDPLKTLIPARTKIPNLFYTGQNINLHGVLGVTVSAILTCSMLLGRDYIINQILKANEEGV